MQDENTQDTPVDAPVEEVTTTEEVAAPTEAPAATEGSEDAPAA